MEQQELSELISENLRLTREVHVIVKTLHRQMIWGRVKFIIKLALLAAILGIGYVTLPAFLEKYLSPYREQVKNIPGFMEQLQTMQAQFGKMLQQTKNK